MEQPFGEMQITEHIIAIHDVSDAVLVKFYLSANDNKKIITVIIFASLHSRYFMSATILAIGLMVFFAHFLSLQFRKTNIPDVLVLMLMGIILGPVLGIVTPQDFGKVGSVVATIALVVILFESGTSLNLHVLGKSLATTGILSLVCFALTSVIITLGGYAALGLPWISAILLGVTLGGTSSAVVIPMVEALRLSEKPATVLVLESSITDVLSIVGVFALLQIYTQGSIEPGRLGGGVLSSLFIAAGFGVLGGIGGGVVVRQGGE